MSERNPVSCLGSAGQNIALYIFLANIYVMDALERKKKVAMQGNSVNEGTFLDSWSSFRKHKHIM
jgi:hypothetical protein